MRFEIYDHGIHRPTVVISMRRDEKGCIEESSLISREMKKREYTIEQNYRKYRDEFLAKSMNRERKVR